MCTELAWFQFSRKRFNRKAHCDLPHRFKQLSALSQDAGTLWGGEEERSFDVDEPGKLLKMGWGPVGEREHLPDCCSLFLP